MEVIEANKNISMIAIPMADVECPSIEDILRWSISYLQELLGLCIQKYKNEAVLHIHVA